MQMKMTENSFPGPMSMIQIDGQKIKFLREQQGLTQLYLATAVDVTTDTISRWENKRYPSIKKENGIRLAEALNVELEELLEKKEDAPSEIKEQVVEPAQTTAGSSARPFKKIWPVLLLSGTLFGVILAFMFFSFKAGRVQVFSAVRIAPNHCIAGQPFPVTIELSGEADKKMAFILKENIPSQAKILLTSPAPRQKRADEAFLKWITKVMVPTSFSYVMQLGNTTEGSSFELSGTIATAGGEDLPITGSRKIAIGLHHWADMDADNLISDKEILIVYDKYAGIQGLEDEIDLIEEIWLGYGYRWNVASQQYDIVE